MYKIVKWTPSRYHYVSREQAERLLAECDEADRDNAAEYQAKVEAYRQLMDLARQIWDSPRAKQVAYLHREGVPPVPSHKSVRKAIAAELKAVADLDKAKIQRKEREERRHEMILALQANGYVLDKDFRAANAIRFGSRVLMNVRGEWKRVYLPVVEEIEHVSEPETL